MDEILNDERFSHIPKDPRFRKIPRTERKVKIDKRFQGMFKDERFKLNYMVDKRGKPASHTSGEDLKKYYDLSSSDESNDEDELEEKLSGEDDSSSESDEEIMDEVDATTMKQKEAKYKTAKKEESESESEDEEDNDVQASDSEEPKTLKQKLKDLEIDYARGEGILASESSSEEDTSDDSDEDDLEHNWGELDKDTPRTEEATSRLALCNMDWDRIKASDLYVLFNSFIPTGGFIQSVTIYPSEYGLERMKEEEVAGPREVVKDKMASDEEEDEKEEADESKMEKFRKYQLNRLKYYYAVITCESPSTANKIYEECDGMEYESSASKVDLRFVPDDMDFDQEPKDRCEKLPDLGKYNPQLFVTTALQQAKVDLTWDETDPERIQLTEKLFNSQEEVDDADLQAYLASDSEDEDEESVAVEKNEEAESDPISKYRALLQGIEEQEQQKKSKNVEMEVTWEVGLKDKAEELVKKKLDSQVSLTPWEQFLEKKKEKKKQRREKSKTDVNEEYSDDEIPSNIDMNDPYFKEELEKDVMKPKATKGKKSRKGKDEEETNQKTAELELMMLDETDGQRHFNLKSIMEKEKKGKKRKWDKKKDEGKQDDFQINVDDPRFSALYTSANFNVDPSHPSFKKTKAMDAIVAAKFKRRMQQEDVPIPKKIIREEKVERKDPDLARLVHSVKNKASNFKWKGK